MLASLATARSAGLGLLLVRSRMVDLTISACFGCGSSEVGAVILNCTHLKALQTWSTLGEAVLEPSGSVPVSPGPSCCSALVLH